ncbi:hypothetical protein D046_5656B, partial [Vibrio parahaemolyticus V-223/04]
LSGQVGSRQ